VRDAIEDFTIAVLLVFLLVSTPLAVSQHFRWAFSTPKWALVVACTIAILALAVIRQITGKHPTVRLHRSIRLWAFVIGWGLVVTFTRATVPHLALESLAIEGGFLVIAWASYRVGSLSCGRWPLWWSLGAASLVASFGLIQYYGLAPSVLTDLHSLGIVDLTYLISPGNDNGPNSITSFLGNRNYTSAYLIGLFPFVLLRMLLGPRNTRRQISLRVIDSILTITFLWFILVSHNRGAWFALAASIALCVLCLRNVTRTAILGLTIATIIACGLSWGSGHERLLIWKTTWNVITETPANFMLGTAPGNYPMQYLPALAKRLSHSHDLDLLKRARQSNYAHCEFLQRWSEEGLIGLVLFVALLFTYFSQTLRYVAGFQKRSIDIIGVAACAGAWAILIHSAFSYSLRLPASGALAAFLIGLSLRHSTVKSPIPPDKAAKTSTHQKLSFRRIALAGSLCFLLLSSHHLAKYVRGNLTWMEAIQRTAQGRLERAIFAYRRAVELLGERGNLLLEYAVALSRCNKHKAALAMLDRARQTFCSSRIDFHAGLCQERLGDPERALVLYRFALKARPAHEATLTAMIRLLLKQKYFDEAIFFTARARHWHPHNPFFHYSEALIACANDRLRQAIPLLRQALQCNPRLVDARYQLIAILETLDDRELAERELLPLLQHSSMEELMQRAPASAVRTITRVAHKLEPTSTTFALRYALSIVLAESPHEPDFQQAVTLAREKLSTTSDLGHWRFVLGTALHRLGYDKEAREHLLAAKLLLPEQSPLQRPLCELLD